MPPDTGLPPRLLYALAVILAAFIGFIGQIVHSKIRTRYERKKLRTALHAEISSIDWIRETDLTDLKESIRNNEDPVQIRLPTTVYDNNVDSIGILSEPEIEALIAYYQAAHVAQDQLEMINEGTSQSTRTTFTDRTLPKLKSRHETAKNELEKPRTWRGKVAIHTPSLS